MGCAHGEALRPFTGEGGGLPPRSEVAARLEPRGWSVASLSQLRRVHPAAVISRGLEGSRWISRRR